MEGPRIGGSHRREDGHPLRMLDAGDDHAADLRRKHRSRFAAITSSKSFVDTNTFDSGRKRNFPQNGQRKRARPRPALGQTWLRKASERTRVRRANIRLSSRDPAIPTRRRSLQSRRVVSGVSEPGRRRSRDGGRRSRDGAASGRPHPRRPVRNDAIRDKRAKAGTFFAREGMGKDAGGP